MKFLINKSVVLPKTTPIFLFSLIGISFFFLASCSTQKNTFTNRAFHSISTKYNGFFNARESYLKGINQLALLHEDNYVDVLNIFQYGGEQAALSIAGNMDVAYQKASTAIRRHSMNIRGVEYNHWIDDCFFLIAKSQFFKKNYNAALLTFYHIIRQFDTPLNHKSMIWVAKTYSFSSQFDKAQAALDKIAQLEKTGQLEDDARLLYFKVAADLQLRQVNYGLAAQYLEKAISITQNRKLKTRLTFILAQSYHRTGNFAKAQNSYRRVLRLNPDFQMAFQARINMALSFETGSTDIVYMRQELHRMLRDERNKEFLDQIYYAKGQLESRQNQFDKAMEYYQLSVDNFSGNNNQKGISFLRMGELFFNMKNYLNAALMYDSALIYISQQYKNIEQVKSLNRILQDLVANIRVINHEDSLQRLASLTPTQRNSVIDAYLAGIRAQELADREQQARQARLQQDMARRSARQAIGVANDQDWYFFNQAALNFGKSEFSAKWGNRALEDMWRLSNRRFSGMDQGGLFTDLENDVSTNQDEEMSRTSMMEDIPLSPEKLVASNNKMAQAYLNKGLILKNQLGDYPGAIKSFEALVTRLPDNEKTLIGAYFLINLLDETGNPLRAQYFRNLIISKFPETNLALILKDPAYSKIILEKQSKGYSLYEKAYEAFLAGNYQLAVQLAQQSANMELSTELMAQFAFLESLAYGRTSDFHQMIQRLTYITDNYVGTKVHQPAKDLLANARSKAIGSIHPPGETGLHAGLSAESDKDTSTPFQSVFRDNPGAIHFFVLVADSRRIQIRELRNQVALFNQSSFQDDNLNLSTLFFKEELQLLTITNFINLDAARAYGTKLMNSEQIAGFDKEMIKAFAISIENYPIFYQEKKLEEYIQFYSATYLHNR